MRHVQSIASIKGWRIITPYDERALQQAVALVGPVSVAVFSHFTQFMVITTLHHLDRLYTRLT